jgi:hypothetical protein
MHVQFDTNEISKRDALCLMALLENIAGVEVPLKLSEKEATRAASCFEPEAVPAGATRIVQPEEAAQSVRTEGEVAKKRGRPRKEQAAEVPEVRPTGAAVVDGPTPSEETTATNAAGAESAPISMDDLRDSVNDHVSRNGMPSAQLVFKEFGCQRANEIMALEPAQQHAFLAKMKK